jgi:very-short-patch-repair endonuclease
MGQGLGAGVVNGHDACRSTCSFLDFEGYRALCFWNNDVLQDTNGVLKSFGVPSQ